MDERLKSFATENLYEGKWRQKHRVYCRSAYDMLDTQQYEEYFDGVPTRIVEVSMPRLSIRSHAFTEYRKNVQNSLVNKDHDRELSTAEERIVSDGWTKSQRCDITAAEIVAIRGLYRITV